MKRTSYRRTREWKVLVPADVDADKLARIAEQSFYRGSPDHKGPGNVFGFALKPPRPNASLCGDNITREEAESCLRDAIKRGNICWTDPTEHHPRYVFGFLGGRLHIARLTNDTSTTGEYKGYPEQVGITVKGLKP